MIQQKDLMISKWPFYLGDLFLVCLAGVIAFKGDGPVTAGPALWSLLCVAFGAALFAAPFIIEYQARVRLKEKALEEKAQSEGQNIEYIMRYLRDMETVIGEQAKRNERAVMVMEGVLGQMQDVVEKQEVMQGIILSPTETITEEEVPTETEVKEEAQEVIELFEIDNDEVIDTEATSKAPEIELEAPVKEVLPFPTESKEVEEVIESAEEITENLTDALEEEPEVEVSDDAAVSEAIEVKSETALFEEEEEYFFTEDAEDLEVNEIQENEIEISEAAWEENSNDEVAEEDPINEVRRETETVIAAEKAPVIQAGPTEIHARGIYGIGNKAFIRGEGAGLSWDKGIPMEFIGMGQWKWSIDKLEQPIKLQVYKNDTVVAQGDSIEVQPGENCVLELKF